MAEYKGKTVTLNKPRAISKGSPGYGKKRKEVFVKNCSSESSRVKRITFGDKKMGMHKDTASRKKSYCARSSGIKSDRCSANYWARRDWDCQMAKSKTKKDACYHKVKARYDVWPSAYASGALVKCRKVGAANWGNKSKVKKACGGEVTFVNAKGFSKMLPGKRKQTKLG